MFRALMAIVALSIFTIPAVAQDKGKETAEQKAVRTYLKENLPSGKFEEIRWGKPIVKKDGTVSIRFKYRSANRSGALEVSDDGFRTAKGKVTEWLKDAGPSFGSFED
jgi:hypothetical protein